MADDNSTESECPLRKEGWPDEWPEANRQGALVYTVLWFLVVLIAIIGLYARRNHQPVKARRITLIAMTSVGLGLAVLASTLREVIGRDVFPCTPYLLLTMFVVPAGFCPILARVLHHRNRVLWQIQLMSMPLSQRTDKQVAELLETKYRASTRRAYYTAALLFCGFGAFALIYQQVQPRYHLGVCIGCEMNTLDNLFLVGMYIVLVIMVVAVMARMPAPISSNEARHEEIVGIERSLKAMVFVAILWLILFRVDPGQLHEKGYVTYAYILDTGMLMLIIQQAIVPVYMSFTTLENPGKRMELSRVLQTPALLECLESFLRREFAVENLRFVLETRRWKNSYPGTDASSIITKEWLSVACDIYNTFIHHHALLEVNLKAETKDELVKVFESEGTHKRARKHRHGFPEGGIDIERGDVPLNLSLEAFDKAVHEIKRLLELDSFPRFLASAEYKAKVYEDFYGTAATNKSVNGTVESAMSGHHRDS